MEKFYDVIIIGAGPAGLTAGLYLARAKYKVLIVEREEIGGQIRITEKVVNYPGVMESSGAALTQTMAQQAKNFGAEILLAEVTQLTMTGEFKQVMTTQGEFSCYAVLLATGANPRTLGFSGEEKFKGRGVAYCATCDGEFFTGKEVFVIGGGYAAAQEGVFLTKYARHVTILVREEDFTCAPAVAQAARDHEKITVYTETEVEAVDGQGVVQSISYRHNATGEKKEFRDDLGIGVFVFVGYAPATELIQHMTKREEHGYVITDDSQRTEVDGLFAAGDVCVKPLRQVVTAVGQAALAATEMEHFVAQRQKKFGKRTIEETMGQKSPESHSAAQKPSEDHPVPQKSSEEQAGGKKKSIFSEEIQSQVRELLKKMVRPLELRLYLSEGESSNQLVDYVSSLCLESEKLTWKLGAEDVAERPCVKIFDQGGVDTGLAFHGVPGGHEFSSFLLGICNASGGGEVLDPTVKQEIEKINEPLRLQILVTLSCNQCPELVVAAQKIAANHPQVSAEVYDISLFPGLREKYQVMSVPCFIINQSQVSFGRKNIHQLLELILESR